MSQLEQFEEDMKASLAEFAERLHPGKTHRLKCGSPPPRGDAFSDAVKFLGIWLQADGKHDRGAHERLVAAQKLWGKLSPRLQRLGLTPKAKGMLINSTVVNCLLYGCERRPFTNKQLKKYQTFLSTESLFQFVRRDRAQCQKVRSP